MLKNLSHRIYPPLCLVWLVFQGCATSNKDTAEVVPPVDLVDHDFGEEEILSIREEPQSKRKDVDGGELALDSFRDNEEVQRWVRYFSSEGRTLMGESLERGSSYRDAIKTILTHYEVPSQIFYLALIESGFKTTAYSVAHASGIWQFIPGTAKRYGLRINPYLDERRDPLRATIAAAHYLSDLKNVFNSWTLALAAYNAGEGRVMGAIMAEGTRDFWELVDRKALPKETREYVPKFLAASIIGEDPEKHGFATPQYETSFPKLVSVKVPSPVHLQSIADQTHLSLHDLKRFNPHLRYQYTPPSFPNYRVWIPEGHESKIAFHDLVRLPKKDWQVASHSATPLRSSRSSAPILNASRSNTTVSIASRSNVPRSNKKASASVIHYKVQPGDSLHSVAKKFGMGVHSIKKLNSLRGSRIVAGQVLRLRQG